MNEKQKGGKRENAGRKPTNDPKIPITVYVETSVVQKNGGRVELARRIVDAVKTDFVENPIMTRVAENNKPKNKKKIEEERNSVPREKIAVPQPLTIDDSIPQMPIREPNEDAFDFAQRKNEWKLKYNQ